MKKVVLYGLVAAVLVAIAAPFVLVSAASKWRYHRLERLVNVAPPAREREVSSSDATALQGLGAVAHMKRVRAFEVLKQRAAAGDAVARRELAATYENCTMVNRDRASFMEFHESMVVQMESAAEAERLVTLTRRHLAECDAVDGGAPVPPALFRIGYAKAAQGGDLAARSMDYMYKGQELDTVTATRHLEEVVASRDPAAPTDLSWEAV